MFASLLVLASSASQPCTIEHAHYQLRTQPTVTADFLDRNTGRDWPSNLVMRLHIGATGRTYWWIPWNGGTDGQQNLASTTDVMRPGWRPPNPDGGPRPRGDADFILTDAHYKVWNHVPTRGGEPPAHFFISQLSDALWHSSPEPRDSVARQFFDLVACR
jgi:hypothetical protein